ncbi:MAG TPA: NFACT RNA binding domain-containing protein [Bacillota bacterium]|mgnify:CR=1 FL=1|jgi:predicted ribosome quality control (RQC) complex YloA/Tae2 family protein|nr:NFACT RNA binding domain-containing protein [Bacillota bacterium]HPT66553.1 NFACT RNA binding domain-containing protein [Bacillota bacterium]
MPLDALYLHALAGELTEKLRNGRIERIYHPLKDRVVLEIRHPYPGTNYQLLLSVHPQYARIHLTESKIENPAQPSAFCMLLRKYLQGGRVLELTTKAWERIITMEVEVYAPDKGLCRRRLVLEAMGRRSNLLVLDTDNTILDALRRSQKSSEREIFPGVLYVYPPVPTPLRPDLSEEALQALLDRVNSQRKLDEVLKTELLGISPFLSKAWAYQAQFNPEQLVGDLPPDAGERLVHAFKTIEKKATQPEPGLILRSGSPVDFYLFSPEEDPELNWQPVADLNTAVERTLHHWDEEARRAAVQASLARLVRERANKINKKLQKQAEELAAAEDAEIYRIQGELLTVNMKSITKGLSQVELPNYYDPENRPLLIPLRPDLSPAENSQYYYNKYQKAKKAKHAIAEQIRLNTEELAYLEGILVTLADPLSHEELGEIHSELSTQGYIASRQVGSSKRQDVSSPRRFVSSDGTTIEVGRNNLQNDKLTFKIASPKDTWLHAQNIPGSHVLIRNNGQPVSDQTLLEAANLAVWYSKARTSTKVPVDYTPRRYVRKPPGSRPGFVLYDPFKTIIITPDPSILSRLGVTTG